MNQIRYLLTYGAVLFALMLPGCTDDDKVGSLYDPNYTSPRPNPTITGIAPAGGALAAVDTLVISGTNFSDVISENTVYIGKAPASILSSTTTQIRLLSPLVTGSNIEIKVGVFRAELFSNSVRYTLSPAMASFGGLGPTEAAGALATDGSGNVYVSIKPEGANARIYRFTPAGQRTEYAPETPGIPQWNSLRLGPGGHLYATRSIRAVYRFIPGGGGAAALWTTFPVGVFATDLDFDQNENLWVVGNNTNIYLVRQDRTTKAFPFTGNVRAARVFSGFLYFASITGTDAQLWRATISGENLGTPEVYVNLSAAFPGQTIVPTSLAVSSDGFFYIGANSPRSMIVVDPSRRISTPYAAYTRLLSTGTRSLAAGTDKALYASTQSGGLLNVSWRKESAPYYAR
jgi:hypothetical protein